MPALPDYPPSAALVRGGSKEFIDAGENRAYNGSLLPTCHGDLLVFRSSNPHGIKYRWLNLSDQPCHVLLSTKQRDPRLVIHCGRLYMTVSFTVTDDARSEHMELYELRVAPAYDNRQLPTLQPRLVTKFATAHSLWPGYQRMPLEKNWVPFSHDGRFMLVQSILPHRVLEVNLTTGQIAQVYESTPASSDFPWPLRGHWGFGWRGSSPPWRLADGSYLSTFHAKDEAMQYAAAFYRFAGEPPFEIMAMDREPALVPADSAQCGGTRQGCTARIIFVSSMHLTADSIHLYGGDSDRYVVHMALPLAPVLARLC